MGRPKKTEGRKPGRPRKNEANIVTTKKADGSVECPRCGEQVSVILRYRSSAGVCRYTCFSERCKSGGAVPGRGRGFIIRSEPSWR